MKLTAALSGAAVCAYLTCARAAGPDEPYWTPDAETIERVEASLQIQGSTALPDGRPDLARYDRYYAGITRHGQRVVRGRLIIPPDPEDHPRTGVHVTDPQYLPNVTGGRCANITVEYYVEARVGLATCALTVEARVPVSEQPHWQPDEATVARLESALRRQMVQTRQKLVLDRYSRYYRGVTINGRRVIYGRVLSGKGWEPGVHLSSESNEPGMSDGFCSNIWVTYDVDAGTFPRLACDGMGALEWPEPHR